MNTYLEYMYRDSGNWKTFTSVVIAGELAMADVEPFLNDGVCFIPHDVDLPEVDLAPDACPENDHCWYELVSVEPSSDTVSVSINTTTLLNRFQAAHHKGWDEHGAMRRLGLL